MGAFGKEYHLWMFAELSQSVSSVLSSFKCSSIMVCLKKMLNGEMSFKKDTEKIVLLKVKVLINIVMFRSKKKLHISIIRHQSSFRAVAPNIAIGLCTKHFVAIKEWMESLYFPEKKINWHGFQIAKVHFSYSIWLMIFEKSIMLCSMVYTFLLVVHACMYQECQQTRHTKKIIYKNFQFF